MVGMGGSPSMGTGGGGMGGTGGGGACTNDASCKAERGDGSLCVADACTKAAGACGKGTLVVVPDPAFDGTLEAGLLEAACFYRALGPALAAVEPSTTTRVLAYAQQLQADGPVPVPADVRLEGRPQAPATTTQLTVANAAGKAMVTLAAGAELKGFALDGGGTTRGVAASTGAVRLEGPLRVADTQLALELTGDVAATVTGTAGAPVSLVDNKRGVFVPTDATLVMQGDGGDGLVVEGTDDGAGVFFEAATTAGGCSTLSGVTLRGNVSSSGGGTGAVEVRRGRRVVIDGCAFENNLQSVTFSGTGGTGTPSVDDFLGVRLSNNKFAAALPTAGGGSVLCGSDLAPSPTKLNLRAGNEFPGTPAALTCDQLGATSQPNCGIGQVFAHSGSDMVRTCFTDTCQCVGDTLQCGGT
jgi:hypothetical protein